MGQNTRGDGDSPSKSLKSPLTIDELGEKMHDKLMNPPSNLLGESLLFFKGIVIQLFGCLDGCFIQVHSGVPVKNYLGSL